MNSTFNKDVKESVGVAKEKKDYLVKKKWVDPALFVNQIDPVGLQPTRLLALPNHHLASINCYEKELPNGETADFTHFEMWDTAERTNPVRIASLPVLPGRFIPSSNQIDALITNKNCEIIAINHNPNISFWDDKNRKVISTIHIDEDVYSATFFSNTTFVTTTLTGKISLWDIKTGLLIKDFQTSSNPTQSNRIHCIYDYDGERLVTINFLNQLQIWNPFVEHPKLELTISLNTHCIYEKIIILDNKLLICSRNDGLVEVINPETSEARLLVVQPFFIPFLSFLFPRGVSHFGLLPNGNIFVAYQMNYQNYIGVLDSANLNWIWKQPTLNNASFYNAFILSTGHVAAVSDNHFYLADSVSGAIELVDSVKDEWNEKLTKPFTNLYHHSYAALPDGRLAVNEDGKLAFYDFTSIDKKREKELKEMNAEIDRATPLPAVLSVLAIQYKDCNYRPTLFYGSAVKMLEAKEFKSLSRLM